MHSTDNKTKYQILELLEEGLIDDEVLSEIKDFDTLKLISRHSLNDYPNRLCEICKNPIISEDEEFQDFLLSDGEMRYIVLSDGSSLGILAKREDIHEDILSQIAREVNTKDFNYTNSTEGVLSSLLRNKNLNESSFLFLVNEVDISKGEDILEVIFHSHARSIDDEKYKDLLDYDIIEEFDYDFIERYEQIGDRAEEIIGKDKKSLIDDKVEELLELQNENNCIAP